MTPLDDLTVPLRGTVLVEASAGTGKTHAITNLYVRLLLERQLSVGEILVVTYTNAATAELRRRIRQRLRDALAAVAGGAGADDFLRRLIGQRRARDDRARLLVALHSFDEAAIFTIHGFCQRMLQEHAFESGVPFDTEMMTSETPLIAEVVQDFWVRELSAAPEDLVRGLAEEKVTLAGLESLAAKVIMQPEMPVLPAADDPIVDAGARGTGHAPALRLQVELAAYARRELRRRKERARLQSFDDLLQRLAQALRASPGLAAAIRRRFPAALVDEFQDTDPVQYKIFRAVYLGNDAVLCLIGDPKQAIYAFRGADVFTYMHAKRESGGEPHTLTVNRRSDPRLIRAVNALFGRLRSPFVFDDIPFLPVAPAADAADRLGGSAAGGAPLQVLFVPRAGQEGRDGFINKAWSEAALPRAVAGEITRFLRSGAMIDAESVQPGDIAVLCRTNRQANLMQAALRALGVPSVLQGDASVFETPEAEEMDRVLRALADPGDAGAIRAALVTTLFGQDAAALHALGRDERRWDDWVRQFQAWHDAWLQRSFIAAFRALLDAHAVAARLLGLLDGERRLTNVLHLTELLHGASTGERRGPHALVRWLAQMRTDAAARAAVAGEAAQIRLESDAAAVYLTTVHRSKGLEHAVVYCPYLWDGTLLNDRDKRAPRFHDPGDGQRLKLDIGSPALAAHRQLAEREAFAESVRLLYVALTRARHRCSVVWGAFRSADSSALGYVLHQPAEADADPRAATVQRIRSLVHAPDDDAMRAAIAAVGAEAPDCISVTDLSLRAADRYALPTAAAPVLRCRTARRDLDLTWRMSSFSALASSDAPAGRPAEEGVDHDAAETAAGQATEVSGGSELALAGLPAGTRTGQFLHEIMEAADFQASGALRAVVAAALVRFGFAPEWEEPVWRALAGIVATPLDEAVPLRLCDIPVCRRLSELEFVFPVGSGAEGRLTADRLAAVFARHARGSLPADYPARLRRLGFAPLAGYLRGFIDLVFEHAGRWYLVDYKSNRLGPRAADYTPSRLIPVMTAHHYFLQSHLYVVALHRYLRVRLPGYDYERDFGGVFYLFLRGMGPDLPRGSGIFSERPPPTLVEALSAVLDGVEGDGP